MAITAGVLCDFIFRTRKFTAVFCINLVVCITDILVLTLGLFDPNTVSENGIVVFFLMGVITDGYCYLFYCVCVMQLARKAYCLERKSVLGTMLGVVYGLGLAI